MPSRDIVVLNTDAIPARLETPRAGDTTRCPQGLDVPGAVSANSVSSPIIVLGGIAKTVWPSGVPGSSGQVLQTGSVALAGMDGVTVTHNVGSLLYLVKVLPTGTDGKDVGEITYVKAANTVTIYNTGEGSQYNSMISADIEISAL